jgi:hypothetical protein
MEGHVFPVPPAQAGGGVASWSSPSSVRGAGGAGAGAREWARLREAAQEFEALLWEQVLRAGLPGDRAWVQGAGEPVYDALVVETLAEAIARGGGAGLWRLLAGAGTR